MIKNISRKLLIATATISIFASSQSLANKNIKPYIGLGYQMSNLYYKTEDGIDYNDALEDGFGNFNLFAGTKIEDKNLSFELGYFKSKEEEKNWNFSQINANNSKSKVELEIISLDATYHQEIQQNLNFLLLGGFSKVSIDGKFNYYNNSAFVQSEDDNQDGYGINLGLGLEAEIAQNIFIRGLAKYTRVNSIDYFDNLTTFSIGAKYQF